MKVLLVLVLGLPLVQTLLRWAAGLLAAMGDKAAAAVIGHVNTGAGVVWLVSLAGLVVLLAIESLARPQA
jgi:hypothetical protein